VIAFLVTSLLALYVLHVTPFRGLTSSQALQSAPDDTQHRVPPLVPAETIHQSPPVSVPAYKPPRCSVTKVSMLYGAHKLPQLEDALKLHQHHSERWGCEFERLNYDLTPRKLYSKHYFLMLTMLRELSRPPEERQEWLL
jgi:hypothetical protein